jgi:hypothetical protein
VVGQLAELAAVDERFEDVLLDGEIAIDDSRHRGRSCGRAATALGTPKSVTLLEVASVRRLR